MNSCMHMDVVEVTRMVLLGSGESESNQQRILATTEVIEIQGKTLIIHLGIEDDKNSSPISLRFLR